ncbi:MAG TPA: hypothetical protein VEG34_03480 [Thermoanaerobaculia bacterium]|nr:hypothetical protein [Thermoanaerobaculia bacterium]
MLRRMFLSALVLAGALSGPLAAFEVHEVQVLPAEPTTADLVTILVSGASGTPCFFFDGVEQSQQNIDFRIGGCPIDSPPLQVTPFAFAGEVGPLPAGTYKVRTILDTEVVSEQAFTVAPATGPCTPSATALCLNGRRFRVEAEWSANGQQGAGRTVPLTGETGAFYFFQPDNVEVVVKVIDGCALNGRFWVFASGLTNVGTVLTVTDAVTDMTRTYDSPAGPPFAPLQDTVGFPCP